MDPCEMFMEPGLTDTCPHESIIDNGEGFNVCELCGFCLEHSYTQPTVGGSSNSRNHHPQFKKCAKSSHLETIFNILANHHVNEPIIKTACDIFSKNYKKNGLRARVPELMCHATHEAFRVHDERRIIEEILPMFHVPTSTFLNSLSHLSVDYSSLFDPLTYIKRYSVHLSIPTKYEDEIEFTYGILARSLLKCRPQTIAAICIFIFYQNNHPTYNPHSLQDICRVCNVSANHVVHVLQNLRL
jgi:transcription initiation factor TFIIIB Brf1 subunit/transcription initiation factor TFIIB